MTPIGMLHPTDDMEASVRYFRDLLGLKQKFRDGDRFCAFELGGMTLQGLSFSAGVAEWAQGESIDQLLDRADKALYEAKRQGRDRAVQAPQPTPPPNPH